MSESKSLVPVINYFYAIKNPLTGVWSLQRCKMVSAEWAVFEMSYPQELYYMARKLWDTDIRGHTYFRPIANPDGGEPYEFHPVPRSHANAVLQAMIAAKIDSDNEKESKKSK
jgi:hypothetical protein